MSARPPVHPYRDVEKVRFPPSAGAAALRRGRWSARLSVLPLAAIVFTFFLPARQGCDGDEVPAVEGFKNAAMMAWVLPSYVVAAILATLLGVAVVMRKTPLSPSRRIAEGALLAHAGCALMFALWVLLPEATSLRDWPIVIVLMQPIVGVLLLAAGHRRRGWRRWSFILAAYTVLAGHLGLMFCTDRAGLRVGGKIFAAAWVGMVLVSIYAIWPARKARAAPG